MMLATRSCASVATSIPLRLTVTARQLAEFLQSVEAQETLLTQRLSDVRAETIRLTLTNEAEVSHAARLFFTLRLRTSKRNHRIVDDLWLTKYTETF